MELIERTPIKIDRKLVSIPLLEKLTITVNELGIKGWIKGER